MTLPVRSVSMKIMVASLACCFVFIFSAMASWADPVIRVLVVKTDNPAAYVKELDTGRAILKKLKSTGEIRVWRASFAGPDTGMVVVTIEWKDLADFAADSKKTENSKEMREWIAGLDSVRTILSDSLFNELKSP